jgi:hypothetical protein
VAALGLVEDDPRCLCCPEPTHLVTVCYLDIGPR